MFGIWLTVKNYLDHTSLKNGSSTVLLFFFFFLYEITKIYIKYYQGKILIYIVLVIYLLHCKLNRCIQNCIHLQKIYIIKISINQLKFSHITLSSFFLLTFLVFMLMDLWKPKFNIDIKK